MYSYCKKTALSSSARRTRKYPVVLDYPARKNSCARQKLLLENASNNYFILMIVTTVLYVSAMGSSGIYGTSIIEMGVVNNMSV